MMSSGRKSHHNVPFAIYCDEPDTTCGSELGDVAERYTDIRSDSPVESFDAIRRRNLNITATSVSSLPSSESEEDYTPVKGPRPSLRSPNDRRTQMNASSADHLSPYRNTRSSSPRKVANARASPRGSPRPRTQERQEDLAESLQPLVLLHVTILPVEFPWSHETVGKMLPAQVLNDLALLKSSFSDTILQRGVLIAHPRDDFDLIEESIIDTLDLGPATRSSCDQEGSNHDDGDEHLDWQGGDCCQTCGDADCFSRRLWKRWEVKIYAANGLLRAGAWEAAWSEMERVDVEILPYVPHHVRMRLNEMQIEGEDQVMEEEANPTTDPIVCEPEEQQNETPVAEQEITSSSPEAAPVTKPEKSTATQMPLKPHAQPSQPHIDRSLPAIYKSKDVPLGVLLSNYIYLLAQDRRNIAIVFLVLTVIFSTMQGMNMQTPDSAIDVRADSGGQRVAFDSIGTNSSWHFVEDKMPIADTSSNHDKQINYSEDEAPTIEKAELETALTLEPPEPTIESMELMAEPPEQISGDLAEETADQASAIGKHHMLDGNEKNVDDFPGYCRIPPLVLDMICLNEYEAGEGDKRT